MSTAKRPRPLAERAAGDPQARVLDELERLQDAAWAAEARADALAAALRDALPLLAHAVHDGPPGCCRRCRVAEAARAALR